MMKKTEQTLEFSNPRLLAAVYYGVLAIIATIILDSFLFVLGAEKILPIFKAILLAVFVAACFGALFGKRIVLSKEPYRKHVFLWGFFMVIVALPVYDLGLIYLLKDYHPTLFLNASLRILIEFYLMILIYSFIMAGLWLALFSGIAALYLRGHLVYYILQSTNQRPRRLQELKIDLKKKNRTTKTDRE